jgi:hypothetical protein
MKREQESCAKPVAPGRLITFSQWDGSALRSTGRKDFPAVQRNTVKALASGTAD